MASKLTVPDIVEFRNNINLDIDKCIEIINNNANKHQIKSDNVRMMSQLMSYYDRMVNLYTSMDIKKGLMDSDEDVDSDIFSSDDSDDMCKFISNGTDDTDDIDNIQELFHGKIYRQDSQSDIIRKQLLGIDTLEISDDDNSEDEFDDIPPDSSVDPTDYHMEKISRSDIKIPTKLLTTPNKNIFKFLELVPEIEIIGDNDDIDYDDI